jgi:cytochrome c
MRIEGRPSRPMVAVLAATVVLALAVGATGCAPSESSTAQTAQPARADVQSFVDKAVEYARANGKEAALAAFTAPGGEFHQGELYIYAYDFTGTVIAHGGDKTLVGKNLIDMKDTNGVMVIQELVSLAKTGDGWLYYTWPNPANGNKQEPKLGYVVKVDDTWFLGSGTYGPAAVKP